MTTITLYHWLVPSGLIIGHLGIAARIAHRWPFLENVSRVLAWVYAGMVVVVWGLRTAEAGHMPMFGTWESALSLALATVAVCCVWELFGRGLMILSPLGALIAGAVLSHGRRFDPTPYALTISERSWVVDVHAILAWAAFAVLAVNNLVALRLVLARGRSEPAEPWLGRALQIGFLLHTGMLVSGSIYKFMLFGQAWSFDPMETMGLATWLVYATLLHMCTLGRWSPRRLAGWCLAAFALLVVSYRAIVYFPPWSTYHILDMDRRIHVGAEELGIGDQE